MKWYLEALKKYVDFSGRASRTEFWVFWLISILIVFGLAFVEGFAGSDSGILAGLYMLAIIPANLSVAVRRLHDSGKSGWSLLLSVIPLLGNLIVLLFFLESSDPGDNEYGPNPKELLATQGL